MTRNFIPEDMPAGNYITVPIGQQIPPGYTRWITVDGITTDQCFISSNHSLINATPIQRERYNEYAMEQCHRLTRLINDQLMNK